MKIRKIEKNRHLSLQRKQVAAYARVSTAKDAQLHSLDTQVDYYRHKIASVPSWDFAGVFVDGGMTGTKRDRKGLEELLDLCREGKIDLVLTKSISRFARNTVDLLNIIRELKELGIAVFFERENINTLSADGELMLTLLASFAQAESISASLNKRWSIKRQFSEGDIVGVSHLYGYDIIDGELIINEHEAKIVRMIYRDYLSGMQSSEIVAKLNKMGEPRKGGGRWKPHDISCLFRNEKHTGNAILQKTFKADPITKRLKRNKGQKKKYYVENSHEAIVSIDTYKAVQEEVKNRTSNKSPVKPHKKPFTGIMFCGKCEKPFNRKKTKARTFWRCSTNLGNREGYCDMKGIPEETLEALCCEVLNMDSFSSDQVKERISRIVVPAPNEIIFTLQNKKEIRKRWKDRSRSESWTKEMRAEVSRRNRERMAKDEC